MRTQYTVEYPAWGNDCHVGSFSTEREALAELHEFYAEHATAPVYLFKRMAFDFLGWTVRFEKELANLK